MLIQHKLENTTLSDLDSKLKIHDCAAVFGPIGWTLSMVLVISMFLAAFGLAIRKSRHWKLARCLRCFVLIVIVLAPSMPTAYGASATTSELRLLLLASPFMASAQNVPPPPPPPVPEPGPESKPGALGASAGTSRLSLRPFLSVLRSLYLHTCLLCSVYCRLSLTWCCARWRRL